jgi:basic membrane lipoprotein Med (substrate-binding protein (PBP1-ABC) superfamily)
LSRGADAIFPVAGPQVIDAVKEIKNQHSNCIVVGTDVEQEYDDTTNEISPYTDTRGDNKIIKFSVLKNITSLTSQMLSLAFAGMQISADGKVGLFG